MNKKQYFILIICLVLGSLSAKAQVEKAIYIKKAGTLIANLTLQEANSITHLTLSGNINAIDFQHLRDEFSNLKVLDLSAVKIRNYIGKNGTVDGFQIYNANAIPAHAFSEKTDYDPKGKPTLYKVILPHGLKSIEKFAFANCPNLEVLVSSCGAAPNLSVGALSPQQTAIFVPAGCKANFINHKDWADFAIIDNEPKRITFVVHTNQSLADLLSKEGIQPSHVSYLTLSGEVDLDDLKLIRDYMSNLVYIDIKNTNITNIPEYTFAQKTNLITVYLPQQLKTIGLRAFDNCNKLGPSLTLPKTVTSIEYGAFNNCSSLITVRAMGNNITAIGEDIFGKGETNKLVYSDQH